MIITIPNILTVVRLLLVPVIIYLIYIERFFLAALLILLAGLSDMADGYIARHYNQKTVFGSNLDPFVDKMMLMLTFIMLTGKGIMPLWLSVTVISRDLIIFFTVFFMRGDRIFRQAAKDVAIRTTMHGKMTTVTQIITILFGLFIGAERGGWVFIALCAVTALVSVITGVDYARKEFGRR